MSSRRQRNVIRNRVFVIEAMNKMPDSVFHTTFRMSRESFHELERKIEPYVLPTDPIKAHNSSGSYITLTHKLGATLRWLAGGSYLDICLEFGIGPGTFFQDGGPLWSVMRAINKVLNISFPFDDEEKLSSIAEGFAKASGNVMQNCVLAIDGWVCRTRQPSDFEVGNVMAYRNRKDCWGIVILAGCDSSDMKRWLNDGRLPSKYYFVGDDAFTNTDQFLTPWAGHGLSIEQDAFNYFLSSMRQCIERAFGLLTQRWFIFQRELRCSATKWTLVATVCAKLHNYCIDREDEAPTTRFNSMGREVQVRGNFVTNESEDEINDHVRPVGSRRRAITATIAAAGIIRPMHAALNSRAI